MTGSCGRQGESGVQGIDLVIFDCDGVLADSEVLSAGVLVRELGACGIDVDAGYVYRHFIGRSFPVVADIIAARFGGPLPKTFIARYRAALHEAFSESLRMTPGLTAMLERLIPPACVATSSSRPRVDHTLAVLGLDSFFGDRVFTASRVAHGKPAPDLFLLAAREMAAPPHRCLVIEDSLAGVGAGLAAGMHVWRYVGGAHVTDVARTHDETPAGVTVIDNWDQMFSLAPELGV